MRSWASTVRALVLPGSGTGRAGSCAGRAGSGAGRAWVGRGSGVGRAGSGVGRAGSGWLGQGRALALSCIPRLFHKTKPL